MRSLQGGLLQGLFVGHPMINALQISFLGEVVLEAMAAAPRRVLPCLPGSPVDLRFFFELEGDKIASLEVIP